MSAVERRRACNEEEGEGRRRDLEDRVMRGVYQMGEVGSGGEVTLNMARHRV